MTYQGMKKLNPLLYRQIKAFLFSESHFVKVLDNFQVCQKDRHLFRLNL